MEIITKIQFVANVILSFKKPLCINIGFENKQSMVILSDNPYCM